jgi:transcriptional pleiotropic regulator of transition state genes
LCEEERDVRRATGIVRAIDGQGRVCLPIELLRVLDLGAGSPLGIFVDDEQAIILRRHETGCLVCDGTEGLEDFHGRPLCERCRAEVRGELL